MHLYRIINKINNKEYIGLSTESNIHSRWSKYKSEKPNRPIIRAIKKYGIENFVFELIYTNYELTENELHILETVYIKRYGSLAPNGYNVVESFNEWMNTEYFRNATLAYNQGNKQDHKNFVGVHKIEYGFLSCIRKGRDFSLCFPSEIEAAEGYDKMALYLYGNSACLNFPEKLSTYLESNLVEVFNKFAFKNYSSNFYGVVFNKKDNNWRVVKYIENKCRHLKYCKSEISAAELYDQVSLFLDRDTNRLNFPDRKNEFLSMDLKTLYDSLAFNKEKSSKYPNVYYIKDRNIYRAEFILGKKIIKCGRFSNEEDANKAVLSKKRELGIL